MNAWNPRLVLVALLTALLSLSGCAGDGTSKSTGEYVDDGAITAKVKSELLADKNVSGMRINVDTYRGTVQLSGFVESASEAERAERIARGVNGVQDVKNNLEVKQ